MKRREFIRDAAVVGTTAGLLRKSGSFIARPSSINKQEKHQTSQQDDSDRSPNRDPMAIIESTLVVNGLDSSVLNEKYIRMLKAAQATCSHFSTDDLQSFADLYNFLDRNSADIFVARTVKEIWRARMQGKIALVLGWQSAQPLNLNPERPMSGPPKTPLRAYHELGLRISMFTYNVANMFAGGNLDHDTQIGLTNAGRRLVEEFHKLRIIADIGGHSSEKAAFDAIEMSTGVPVICSHTNVKALNDNVRCISNPLIEAIAKTGGVIGITAVNDFLVRNKSNSNLPITPPATLDKYLDQFDYVRKLIGVDYVGLGPDFVEGIGPISDDSISQTVWPIEYYSKGPSILYVKGFENIVQLPNVVRGLIQRGWSTGEIRKILGGNWLRIYQQVWGA
jgi:membrane dipeptidase